MARLRERSRELVAHADRRADRARVRVQQARVRPTQRPRSVRRIATDFRDAAARYRAAARRHSRRGCGRPPRRSSASSTPRSAASSTPCGRRRASVPAPTRRARPRSAPGGDRRLQLRLTVVLGAGFGLASRWREPAGHRGVAVAPDAGRARRGRRSGCWRRVGDRRPRLLQDRAALDQVGQRGRRDAAGGGEESVTEPTAGRRTAAGRRAAYADAAAAADRASID